MQPYLWVWLIGAPIVIALIDLLATMRSPTRHSSGVVGQAEYSHA